MVSKYWGCVETTAGVIVIAARVIDMHIAEDVIGELGGFVGVY